MGHLFKAEVSGRLFYLQRYRDGESYNFGDMLTEEFTFLSFGAHVHCKKIVTGKQRSVLMLYFLIFTPLIHLLVKGIIVWFPQGSALGGKQCRQFSLSSLGQTYIDGM